MTSLGSIGVPVGTTSALERTMDTKQQVLDAMKAAGEPLNAGKIVDMTGLERKEVDKAMADLKKTGEIVSPKRCYWSPA